MEVFAETDSDAPRAPSWECPDGSHCTWQTLVAFLTHMQTGGGPDYGADER